MHIARSSFFLAVVAVLGIIVVSSTFVHAFVATETEGFYAALSGDNHVHEVTADTEGSMDATFLFNDENGEMHYQISVSNGEAITMAHLHCGASGTNGPVLAALFSTSSPEDVNGILVDGVLTENDLNAVSCPSTITTLKELRDAMQNQEIYVNVHSAAYPDGVIRGPFTSIQYSVPPVAENAWEAATCDSLHKGVSVPNGYAAAYTFFTSAKENVIRVVCGDDSAVHLLVGSSTAPQIEYVYEKGYVYDGERWVPLALDGERVTTTNSAGEIVQTAWFKERASGTVSLSSAEGAQFAVAYVCTYDDAEWKCGCPTAACTQHLWQLQTFILE